MTHTPGPWKCEPEDDLHKAGVYGHRWTEKNEPGEEIIIADVTDEDVGRKEFLANCRLMVQIPALLAFCLEVAKYKDQTTEQWRKDGVGLIVRAGEIIKAVRS